MTNGIMTLRRCSRSRNLRLEIEVSDILAKALNVTALAIAHGAADNRAVDCQSTKCSRG